MRNDATLEGCKLGQFSMSGIEGENVYALSPHIEEILDEFSLEEGVSQTSQLPLLKALNNLKEEDCFCVKIYDTYIQLNSC